MSEHVNRQAAEKLVQQVSTWYSQQIIAERRAPAPDAQRLKHLTDLLAACAADRQALEDAEADEIDAIAARYAARAKEFEGQ
ncbi:hypothetical protein [Streptomyces sp. G44]|uniref:hypothetical protein n=1 Tax=Streptomyces sp. G44 TaxID=2807632 RepID=UPI001EF8F782|nr:hypothetical protein [Streptomyces sp. G44]